MSDELFDALLAEADRDRIGVQWLEEIRAACIAVARRFDPMIYGVAEGAWTEGEIDELVQDVTLEQLLKQGQIDYIVDVARSTDELRRLLQFQVRRALVRRRRVTVVDRLIVRIRAILEGPEYELIQGPPDARYRPLNSNSSSMAPTEAELRRATAAVRLLPMTSAGGDRAPAVFRSDVLRQVVVQSFAAAGANLSIDDFGRILRDALTSWYPVVLELSEEVDQRMVDSAESAIGQEHSVNAILEELSDVDQVILRSKLSGVSDSDMAEALGVSRPTAAKRRAEAFARLRSAWQQHASDVGSLEFPGLAQLLYLKLLNSGDDR